MENVCEICGFKYPPEAHYCGMCGVDLTDKTELLPPVNQKKASKRTKKKDATKETPSNDDVINWCAIHSAMRWHDMTFPLFVNLVWLFAEGKKDLGFCDCAVCNFGYRELEAYITNFTEKKKLKPSSREIVSKCYGVDITGKKIHFPDLFNIKTDSKAENKKTIDSGDSQQTTRKVTIEIDRNIIEDLILDVLSSEKGQQILKKRNL